LNQINKALAELYGKRTLFTTQIENFNKILKEMIELEEKRELYEYYSKAVGRNGIPYQVICSTVPEVTREINALLSQVTNFTVEMETDEKNITPYVNYETKGRWAIEMTCGFERFVASIAIRIALTKISNLPRSNFLIIDEGFGSLDGHNLPSMYTLFTFLKSEFDFVLVVSHLDSLKDMVDKQIEVSQIGNFSKVVFE
jgi:DNA repair exonuclease SbcCD ATPase subunit